MSAEARSGTAGEGIVVATAAGEGEGAGAIDVDGVGLAPVHAPTRIATVPRRESRVRNRWLRSALCTDMFDDPLTVAMTPAMLTG
jgi:hypothetical protein